MSASILSSPSHHHLRQSLAGMPLHVIPEAPESSPVSGVGSANAEGMESRLTGCPSLSDAWHLTPSGVVKDRERK
jgi:hypothetical protein